MSEGLTVDVELGLVVKISDFNLIKPMAAIRGLRVDGDVPAQLEQGLDAIVMGWAKIDQKLEELVLEELVQDTGSREFSVVENIRKELLLLRTNLGRTVDEVKRQKELLGSMITGEQGGEEARDEGTGAVNGDGKGRRPRQAKA